MNINYYVPTGTILKEYLLANNITQKDLSIKSGVSEKYISNLINGETKMTEEFAIALEKIFKDVPAMFWLNLEAKYRLALAREKDNNRDGMFDIREIAQKFRFNMG